MAGESTQSASPKGGAVPATAELPVTAYSWVVISMALAVYGISFVDRLAWAVAIPIAAPAMKLTMAEAGALMTAFYIGYVASNIPAGWLADRFGARLTLGISTLITGSFTFLFPVTDSYAMGFVFRVLAGLGGGAIFACGVKFQLGWFPLKLRGMAMGIFMTGVAVGQTVANGFLPAIIQANGWKAGFTYAGAGALVVGVLVLLFAKDRGLSGPRPKKAAANPGSTTEVSVGINMERSLRATVWNRSFVLGTITLLLAVGCIIGFNTWAITFFSKGRGFSLIEAGTIVAGMGVTSMIAPFAAGVLSDFLKRRKVLCVVGGLGAAACYTLLGVTTDVSSLWAIMLVLGVVGQLLGIPLNVWQAENTAGPHSGTAMGIYNAVGQLGSVIYPTVLGMILDATGSNYMYIMATIAVSYVICSGLVVFMDDRTAREAKAAKAAKMAEASA